MPEELWRIKLLGELSAQKGGLLVTHFETRKTGALLACLALRMSQNCPREAIAEQLWPDEEWDATRNRLRQALSSLRRELEPAGTAEGTVLIADRTDVRLNPAAVTTDVIEFEAALACAARTEDPTERIALLRGAVQLYRGDLLPGYYEEWLLAVRERLSQAYADAMVRLADALAAVGDLAGAIEAGRRAVAEDPLREDSHCNLMRFYAAAGRTAEALRQYRELERRLRDDLGAAPSEATRALYMQLHNPVSAIPTPGPCESTLVEQEGGARPQTEPEGGAMPLSSQFYIVRPTDAGFTDAISRQDSIVLVKGPRQVGKTSLLARGLQRAREIGARVVMTDLQKLAPEQLESAELLFVAFTEMLADQLDLDICPQDIWNPQRGWNVNFEKFMRREVLSRQLPPLVWGLDEVDRLFGCPFSDVVFGLFRSWHNERSLNPDGPWSRLTLAIAYATEAHLFITDLNQSPFNVGTRLTLEDFTRREVEELNRRHGSPLANEAEVVRFFALVGGHPSLVRRSLHTMAEQSMNLAALEADASQGDGIFGGYLQHLASSLSRDTALSDALEPVLYGRPCPSAESFYRLRSAGILVGRSADEAKPRCGLYRMFLERHLPGRAVGAP